MRIKSLLLAVLLISGCGPAPEPTSEPGEIPPDTAVTSPPVGSTPDEPVSDPYAPQPGDSNLIRGNAFVQETDLLILESFPPQFSLTLKGELPTPCNQLRVQVEEPDQENKINVNVYSVVNPDLVCTQVVEPFEANINLGTFPSGHYSVWVNEELAVEFDS